MYGLSSHSYKVILRILVTSFSILQFSFGLNLLGQLEPEMVAVANCFEWKTLQATIKSAPVGCLQLLDNMHKK